MIKIDTREQELFAKCASVIENNTKFKSIQLISETLPLGDIIINDGMSDHVIIERKTLNDLAASIKDGRYEEQSYRLNGLPHHNHNIVYLIEGDFHNYNSFKGNAFKGNSFKDRIDKQTLYSAMFSIHYFKGFSVMRTNNMEETAAIVCNMVYKLVNGLKAGKTPYYSINKPMETLNEEPSETPIESPTIETNNAKDYCSVIKKVKKENVTQDNIGEIMLCQIPGVSSTTALAILSQFKTLPNLILSLKENDKCLNDICTTDANGKNRKISKTTIATIVDFLKI